MKIMRADGTIAYKFNPAKVDEVFDELSRGLQVFISCTRSIQSRAELVCDILRAIGVRPRLDIHNGGNVQKRSAIDDSCLITFLITPDFISDGANSVEITSAVDRYHLNKPERFNILPIIIAKEIDGGALFKKEGWEADGTLPALLDGFVCQYARTDAEIIDYIVNAMPVRLGITDWKESQPWY